MLFRIAAARLSHLGSNLISKQSILQPPDVHHYQQAQHHQQQSHMGWGGDYHMPVSGGGGRGTCTRVFAWSG
jgi:hypothetical protein